MEQKTQTARLVPAGFGGLGVGGSVFGGTEDRRRLSDKTVRLGGRVSSGICECVCCRCVLLQIGDGCG